MIRRILLSLFSGLALFGQVGYIDHADAGGRVLRGTRAGVAAPAFINQSAPGGTQSSAYSYTFTATGSPTFALGTGTLPAGLSLSSGGVLSGTPTTATSYTFTVNATNGGGTTASSSQNVTIAASGSSAITSSVVASRTSCTAPCFIFFDATGTTSSDSAITNSTNGGTFRQITHSFDFGDTGAGTWAYSGKSKNTQTGGPITGHIYEAAGTYTVNVTHSHAGTSDKAATPITITVSDPDTVYSGTNTVCINGTGTNDGLCPSGASYVSAAPGTLLSNRRYLFKRGGSYNAAGELGIGGGGQTGIRVGAYGSGAKPIIVGGIRMGENTSANDIVAQDLEVNKYVIINSGANLVALRLDVTSPQGPVGFYMDETAPYKNMLYHAIIDSSASDPGKATMIAGAYGVMAKGWIAGLYVPHVFQHDVRLNNSYKTAIQHSWLPYDDGYGGTGHSIKMHASGSGSSPTVWDEVSSTASLATSYNVISDNILHSASSDGNWTVAIDSQNSSTPEGVTDVIVENNTFYRGTSGSPTDIVMGGRRITYRGNTSANGTMLYSTGTNNPPAGWDGPYFSN